MLAITRYGREKNVKQIFPEQNPTALVGARALFMLVTWTGEYVDAAQKPCIYYSILLHVTEGKFEEPYFLTSAIRQPHK